MDLGERQQRGPASALLLAAASSSLRRSASGGSGIGGSKVTRSSRAGYNPPGRGFRPGADRLHTAKLPPSPSEDISPAHSPLTTRVLFPILMLSFPV